MASCVRCGRSSAGGTLCADHARELATARDLTAEQIVGADLRDARAWLIDQWGASHALGPITSAGRTLAPDMLSVLHPSVSALHAQIECVSSDVARVVDRGSLNGTFVDGTRVQSADLREMSTLRLGDVSFLFTTSPMEATSPSGAGRTAPSRSDELLFSATVHTGDGPVSLLQTSAGGIVRVGATELVLGRLEFGLVLALAEKRLELSDPAQCFLSSRDLTACLDFNSSLADSENVRELVRRVRKKLKEAGVRGLIESRQGAGYRLGWPIQA